MAMPENHGGARDGAGRPSNAEKYSGPIGTFTDAAAAYLSQAFLNLQALAEGSERVEEKRALAGTLTRKDVVRDADGVPVADSRGKLTVIEIHLYPDLPNDELVMVERKTIRLPPDYKANEYLGNRVMGTPRQSVEHSAEGGGPVEILVRYADDRADTPEAAPGAGEDPPGDEAV